MVFFLFELVYWALAYHILAGNKGPQAVAKSFAASLIAIICWVVFSGGLVALYIATGFGMG
jgi:hypothetical protein